MTETQSAASASEHAILMIESGAGTPICADDRTLHALAWALKDLGYAAWNSDPPRVARVADALRRLDEHAYMPPVSSSTCAEVRALSAWITGIEDLTRGRMTDATARFDQAHEGFRELGLHREAAQTQVPKVITLSVLGRHAEAAACGEQTQRELLALGDALAASKVSLNLGNLYCRCNDYPLAKKHYREAAVLFARVGDKERSIMADIGMAEALASMGDFEESLHISARARMRAAQHGFPVLGALAQEAIALVALSRGHYHEALAELEGSRRCYEALAMPQHLATAEKQLADAYLELRLLPEALALFDQALQRFDALEMPVEQAWALTQKGRTQALLDRPIEEVHRSLMWAARLFAGQQVGAGEATVLLARAELALARGEGVSAITLAHAAASGFAATGLAEGGVRAAVVGAYASLLAGRADESRALFVQARTRARELRMLSAEVRCLAGEGLAALAAGDEGAARESLESAIEAFEDQRRALPSDDIRSVFLTDHLRPYQELLRLALAASTREPSSHHAAEVLRCLERFRARVLDERLGEATAAEGDEPDDEVASTLRARLNWLYRRMQRLDEEAEPGAALVDEARRIELELLERARRQRFAAQAGPSDRHRSEAFDVQTLQSLLGVTEALVEYGALDNQLFACVVTHDRLDIVHPLAAWDDVLDAMRSARFQVETLRHGAGPVERHLDILTQRMQVRMSRLHDLVWVPLAHLLVGRSDVVVVPHEHMSSLPFAALHDGERFLAQTHALAMAPSAQVAIRGLVRQPVPALRALAVGESRRLPQAAAEAQFVAGLFDDAIALTGASASLAQLQLHASQADVIHLACHAQFRADNPMFSALHLVDGALTADAIEHMSLRAATVVLSACETGLAEHGRGDEMVGLVRAFLLAGASRIVASLWPVDDTITARFMSIFYGALRAGQAPAEALRHAQVVLMVGHPHPCHWAAFALHGGT